MAAVRRAIKKGRLQPATSFRCEDCGKVAEVYDHRDYSKPLEVHALCNGCNISRGPATAHDLYCYITLNGRKADAREPQLELRLRYNQRATPEL